MEMDFVWRRSYLSNLFPGNVYKFPLKLDSLWAMSSGGVQDQVIKMNWAYWTTVTDQITHFLYWNAWKWLRHWEPQEPSYYMITLLQIGILHMPCFVLNSSNICHSDLCIKISEFISVYFSILCYVIIDKQVVNHQIIGFLRHTRYTL